VLTGVVVVILARVLVSDGINRQAVRMAAYLIIPRNPGFVKQSTGAASHLVAQKLDAKAKN
jgi:hypothetical protein